ncbi:acetylornithine deacetylase [Ruegeria sp. R13_0]|uniref:acetylornithine deacetylase n=1 Tax=Ruegeria sp. R13_0 TaxID=2821099 RepID=UPI001ADAEA6F|nr:acetylornithine deacetylase [Ruegeria sp. R13_0]MBO9433321.1 acetylornithine deacetylase [Ruegeria sp. R13_0]
MSVSLEVLERLVAFETISARSNLDMIAYIEDFLRDRGFRVQRIADPDEPKAGLFAEIGPSVEGGLLLSAHSDVVPVEGQDWSVSPFKLTRQGDRLFGRGTTDMKGFLAEMLALADAMHGRELKTPLKLLVSYDEEIGCVGISRMKKQLPSLLGRPRLAIVGEPTEMQVAIGHKGKRAYRADIRGEAGHSALAPQFVNALHVAVDFVGELRHLQQKVQQTGIRNNSYDVPYTTFHVGQLSGGTALNLVPDKASLVFEFRHLAEDDPDKIEAELQQAADAVLAKFPPAAQISLRALAGYPGLSVASSDPAVSLVKSSGGGETTHVAFGTEAGVLSELGIATVVCGPGSMADQGHKPDEYVSEKQLVACSLMLRKVADEVLLSL